MTTVTDPRWTHVVTGGPWYERRGLRCRVLTPFDTPGSPANVYPWAGLGEHEVLVLIENDPLDSDGEFGHDSRAEGWSCAIRAADLTPIDSAA